MKNLAIFLILFTSTIYQLDAQYQVTGRIKDASNAGLEFANVILLELPDSNIVTVVTSDIDGTFKFENLKAGKYMLRGMLLGYKDCNSESFNLGLEKEKATIDFVMEGEAQMLQTIEVKAKVPVLEQRADRLVVNVAQSLTGLNGSLMDVLKKVPGMLIVNDRISMAGQSSVTILLNGRTTQYMDINALLREMPSENIEKIEVIHQPGAEFDAAGTGPVINIVLKQKKLFGTNGSVKLGAGKGAFYRYNASFTFNHRQGDLNLYGSAGYSHNTWDETLQLERLADGDIFRQTTEQPSLPHSRRGNLGADWYISEKHSAGVSVDGLFSTNNRDNLNRTDIIYADGSPTTQLLTTNTFQREWWYLSSNFYYAYKIDTLGQKLDVDFNHTTFERDNVNLLTTENISNDGLNFDDQRNAQPGSTDLYAITVDYTKPFSKSLTFQTGVKYSDASLDNNLQIDDFQGGEWVPDLGQSNHFLFDETIQALYAKVSLKKEDWEMTAGLRYEDSRSIGYSTTLDSTTRRDIRQFFPSASISKTIAGPLAMAVAYSYRIDRPGYSELNPFVYSLDPFTFERGNPQLRPELTHSLKLSMTYEKQPFFNLEYTRTNNAMTFVTEQDEETQVAFATTINLDKFERIGGSLFFPLDFIKGFSGYGGVMAYHNQYDAAYLDDIFLSELWTVTGFIQANFTLPLDIKAEINGWITSGGQDGIIEYGSLYGLSLGFERKFFNDKVALRMSIDDLLIKYWDGRVDYANLLMDLRSTWNAQVINFQLKYSFGNQFMKARKSRSSSASEEINRAK